MTDSLDILRNISASVMDKENKELKKHLIHKKELINLPFNGEQEIDTKLVPLIKELNKVGLITVECCQGGKGTLADEPDRDSPSYITLEMGKNVTFAVKPLGSYDRQRLVIYWKKKGENILY